MFQVAARRRSDNDQLRFADHPSIVSKIKGDIHLHNDRLATSSAIAPGKLETWIPALAGTAMLIGFVSPRATPGLLALMTVPAILAMAIAGRLERPLRPGMLEAWMGALGIYLIINAAWSVDKGEAYGKVAFYFLILVVMSLAATAFKLLEDETLVRLRRAIALVVIVGAVFLSIESVFEQPIKRFITSVLPMLRPPKKHIEVDDGWVKEIGLYVLNRNIAMLSLALWPAFLLMRDTFAPRTARIAVCVVFALTAAAVFRSEHETSMIGLVVASITFAGMKLTPKIMRALLIAGWVVATVLVVPIAAASYSAQLYKAQWIPKTGRNRIVLWGVTAAKVREAPLLGIGVKSTKPLDLEASAKAAWPKDHPYPLRTGRHSHNVYMQTWYELGAIGAAFLLGIGLLVMNFFARQSQDVQPYLFASFASTAILGALSWGLWQPWFMAAFAMWGVLVLMVVETQRAKRVP
ncbi:MAG: O-antigen ligase family protein [Hyphomicrobiaceae bacterium]